MYCNECDFVDRNYCCMLDGEEVDGDDGCHDGRDDVWEWDDDEETIECKVKEAIREILEKRRKQR